MMEAKDTVIGQKESDMIRCPNCGAPYVILYKNIREAQAETSFKAGYKTGRDDLRWGGYRSEAEVFKAGIKEVVEWIKEHDIKDKFGNLYVPKSEWQAKVKEWGIEG